MVAPGAHHYEVRYNNRIMSKKIIQNRISVSVAALLDLFIPFLLYTMGAVPFFFYGVVEHRGLVIVALAAFPTHHPFVHHLSINSPLCFQ